MLGLAAPKLAMVPAPPVVTLALRDQRWMCARVGNIDPDAGVEAALIHGRRLLQMSATDWSAYVANRPRSYTNLR